MTLVSKGSLTRARTEHHPRCTCAEDTLETPWKAEMCTILHIQDRTHARAMLDTFFSEHAIEINRVLGRTMRIARLRRDEDDVALSYFGQALLRMINTRWRAKDDSPRTTPVFDYSRNLPTILESETRSCLRDDRRRGLLDSTAGIPGDLMHDRKSTHVKKSRQLFEIEYKKQPSDDELVTFHNDRMRATRKDAARQSVLITKADLQPPSATSLDHEAAEADSRISVDRGTPTTAVEWSDRITAIINRCRQLDTQRESTRTRRLARTPVCLVDVARVYFAHHDIGKGIAIPATLLMNISAFRTRGVTLNFGGEGGIGGNLNLHPRVSGVPAGGKGRDTRI